MFSSSLIKNKYFFLSAGFFGIAVVLLFLSPAEASLGQYVKVIYLHSALIWATLLAFASSFTFLTLSLISKNERHFLAGYRLFVTGSAGWFLNGVLSLVTMKVIWGSIAWQEPRFISMVTVLFMLMTGFSSQAFFKKSNAKAAIYIAVIGIIFLLWLTARDVIHPSNAISGSKSLPIILYTVGITLSLFVSGISLNGLFSSNYKESNK